jgi:lysophospholipid acyltransferase 5
VLILLSTSSYAGKYEDGTANWTGCANVKLRRLESAAQFGHYIAAFNINTNGWVASYVYKVPLPSPSETTF